MTNLKDPEVSTLQTLTNVQNSLFVPSLGRFLNRTPTYNLTRRPTDISEKPSIVDSEAARQQALAVLEANERDTPPNAMITRPGAHRQDSVLTIASITSVPSDKYYAVLPHGVRLEGWTQADVDELNDHVRHMLHSRRSKFRRGLRGFGQYVRRRMFFCQYLGCILTGHSPGFSRDALCYTHNNLWPPLGIVLDWYVDSP